MLASVLTIVPFISAELTFAMSLLFGYWLWIGTREQIQSGASFMKALSRERPYLIASLMCLGFAWLMFPTL